MANPNNLTLIRGRLTRDPMVFTNKDGSRKIKATVAAKDDFKSRAAGGDYTTQFINVESFFSAHTRGNGGWDYLKKGSYVNIVGHIKTNNWVDKTGHPQYGMSVIVDTLEFGHDPMPQTTPDDDPSVIVPQADDFDLPFEPDDYETASSVEPPFEDDVCNFLDLEV